MNHPRFEANAFPLSPGRRLLEASAGTGKTFALAHLVLRLLSEGSSSLTVEQLLVVTFTEAAAAELQDRIARRLQQALGLLQGGDTSTVDPILQEWFAVQPPRQHRLLEGRLLLALERLDRADITTIHGFCRRTLQRQALEAGLGPAVSLESQGQERREQVVHDYWNQQVLPLPASLLAGVQQRGVDPESLLGVLGKLDGDPALELDPLPEELAADEPLFGPLERTWNNRWQRFLDAWRTQADALEQALASAAAELKGHGASYSPFRLKPKPDRVQAVQRWIDGLDGQVPGYDAVLAQADLQKYFHPGPFTKVAAVVHGDRVSLPEPQLMEAIAALVDGPAEDLLLHFSRWARQELLQRRERSGQISFGQLLSALDPGRDNRSSNPLLEAVAGRYKAALIDEFQDTDPIQWRILERAFSREPTRHLLVMVGDPKQAIYRFRGGELTTYRIAAASADHCFGLYENRRSSEPLVKALNHLMQPGMPRSALQVPAVEALANKGTLELQKGAEPLQLLEIDPERLETQVASFCQQLLEQQVPLKSEDGSRPLEPGDLCLLVNQHAQAEALRAALEQQQLPSRLVSRGDVFESLGATALQRFLDALAQPGHNGRQRLLVASPLLGWSATDILAARPDQWDLLAASLSTLAERLPRQGLTAVLAQLQGSEGLARLSLRGRVLADLQQAAELVQEQMHKLGLGASQAADWLRRQRLQESLEPPDAHRCRSDAAESAIAVVTVHRSKGLEYPVVICPYLWKGCKPVKADRRQVGRRWIPSPQSQPHLDLHLNPHWGRGRLAALQDQHAQAAEAERLAYVACTRARHLLVLGWPGADRAEDGNPLSPWLMAGSQPRDVPLQRVATPLGPMTHPWRAPLAQGSLTLGPRPTRDLDRHWGRASYSAWAHSQASVPPEMREDGRDTDALAQGAAITQEAEPNDTTLTWSALGPLAHFPRGAGPGDALHRILEQIDYGQLATGDSSAALDVIGQELPRAGLNDDWCDTLMTALLQLVQTPMGGELGTFKLGDLRPGEWLNEMNFDLPLAQGSADRLVRNGGLARVFLDHPGGLFNEDYGHQVAQLEVASRGFLTGSIDLVFQCKGKWWIADWKSNWLGQRDHQGGVSQCGPINYSQEAMAALMTSNHYPLQAHLYSVALHRYLHWRLKGYDPTRDLGGYAYVFLRGVPGTDALKAAQSGKEIPGMLVDQPPLGRVLALDRLLREGQP
ncbi:MAG: UvrD-helicase domain-containing protein [Synechococcus sp.]|nr:UvrD-helicase domain-containing protein [Synechococcus sp.]